MSIEDRLRDIEPTHEPIMSLEREPETGYNTVVLKVPSNPDTEFKITQKNSRVKILYGLESMR